MVHNERRRVIAGLGAAGATLLAGCTGVLDPSTDSGAGGGDRTTTARTTETPATNVGIVYSLGGLGDKSFNDMANRGIQSARLDFGIEYTNKIPQGDGEFDNLQEALAASTSPDYELVCCIGFSQAEALQSTAGQYDDQRFMIVDSVVDHDNVASYVFEEQEGSFQVGHLAGALTSTDLAAGAGETNPDAKTVGFVGGVEVPLIRKFEAGYVAGVAHADEEVEVLTGYAGSFADPKAGKELAAEMYDQGADLVYHAAGGTGLGVFEAAQEHGRFAIGVDSDQSRSDPRYANVILASMVKRVNTAVYSAVESVADGTFSGESVTALGLERDGLAVVYGEELGPAIPKSVKDDLAVSRQGIVSGEIEVPTDPAAGTTTTKTTTGTTQR